MSEIIKGTITKFAGKGRGLGYPTANIITSTKLADGIYFGTANLGQHMNQPTLIFIGIPTTVGDIDRRIEAHLLDIPDEDYYGSDIVLKVQHFHRPNQKFDSIDELKVAMNADEMAVRKWFRKH